ncbi:hypothetical protein EJ06DRAFT_532033 [Trichodelitschia bisporula]|uniref:Uncharacterized protein n=1 Tax=Trichodelitschia bisporula TaxID=703511 RepID=A0A6G1HR16_9PEZI|nr:hypothetical protein EJ06DRAFT_532033 [Trichodelitschia bisporula]
MYTPSATLLFALFAAVPLSSAFPIDIRHLFHPRAPYSVVNVDAGLSPTPTTVTDVQVSTLVTTVENFATLTAVILTTPTPAPAPAVVTPAAASFPCVVHEGMWHTFDEASVLAHASATPLPIISSIPTILPSLVVPSAAPSVSVSPPLTTAPSRATLPSGMTAPFPVLPKESPIWVNRTEVPDVKGVNGGAHD